ncbi:glycosyltransferase family 39 protein [Lewinella sp. JB7]|uniref:glycosyltransferase family 39 protein n=1 Tax=Lewinella sp. JB7 TaxID=2962887 RepID=UPI0020CA04D2|nr:glycosyltransferase family 39 protein [Lewinella sp. JB7]MCP9235356.1 glycosyltransferase family 39 protein [Lewinella sp. JB7]
MKRFPTPALLLCYLMIVVAHLYYPKWAQGHGEATLSYDVSGYYLYLPAVFIYDDLRDVAFLPDIIEKYHPTDDPYQTFTHESGKQVMKYSLGQAILYAPFFTVAHAYASASDTYPADGFSRPYQLSISFGGLLVSFLGLYFLQRVLRRYYSGRTTSITLLLITFATNYLNYAAIDNALTHNWLFTLYALLLHLTHRLYYRKHRRAREFGYGRCLSIGLLLGLMALTRPTEILAVLIPLFWGIRIQAGAFATRWRLLAKNLPQIGLAVVACIAVGTLQLLYWKYVTDDWIVYSYQDQGFDWWQPHLIDGLFSYKAGWLTYTPAMWIALIGFWPLYRRRQGTFLAPLLFFVLFVYVAFAWSVWWYGGSLGQRTMVQAYPVLAFPLAASVSWVLRRGGALKSVFIVVAVVFVAHNLWFTHQAHRGGLLMIEWMNRAYYWRTLFTFEVDTDDQLLLDNPEFYRGTPDRIDTLYTNGFETSYPAACTMNPIAGSGSLCLMGRRDASEEFFVNVDLQGRQWVRASVDCRIRTARPRVHYSTQLVLRFYRDGVELKERVIRLHRVLNAEMDRNVYIEARAPRGGADAVSVLLWNGGDSQPAIVIDNLVVATLE